MQKHSPISARFEHVKLRHIPACIGVLILCTMLAISFFVSSSYAQDSSDSTQTDPLQPEEQEDSERLDLDRSGGVQGGSTGLITNLVNELPEIDLFVYADQSQSIFADPDGDGQKPATKLVEMIRTAINSPISPLASRKVLDRGGRIFLYGFGDNDITKENPYDCSDDIRTFLDGESAGSGEIDAGLQNYEGTSAENKITNLSCVFDHIKNNENINQAQNDNRQPMILIASDFLHDPFNVSTMPVPPPSDFQLPEQGICDFLEGYYRSNQLPPSLDEALVGMDFLERGGSRRYIATLEMQLTREDFSKSSSYSQCAINSAGADRLAAKLISSVLNAERFGFEDLDGNSFAERFAEQMLYAIAPPPVLDNVNLTQKLGSDTLNITFMEPSGLPATIRRLEFGSEATGWTQVRLNQPVELAGGQEQNYTQEIRLPEAQRSGDLGVRAIYTRENGTSELITQTSAVASQFLSALNVRPFSVQLDTNSALSLPVPIENPNDTGARLAAIRILTQAGDGETLVRLPEADSFFIAPQKVDSYNLRDTAAINKIRKAASQGLWVEIAADGQNLPRGENRRGRITVRPPPIICPIPSDNPDAFRWRFIQDSGAGASGYELDVQLRTEEPAQGIYVDSVRIAGVANEVTFPGDKWAYFTESADGGAQANVNISFLNNQLNNLKYSRKSLDITFLYNGAELCTVRQIPTAPDASEKFQIINESWDLRRDEDTQNLILEFQVYHENRSTNRRLDNIYLEAIQPDDNYQRNRLGFEVFGQNIPIIPPSYDRAVTVRIDLDRAGIGEAEFRNRGLLLISERFDLGSAAPLPIPIPERLLQQISINSFDWLTQSAGATLTISSRYASSAQKIVFSSIAEAVRPESVVEVPLPDILKLRVNEQQNVELDFNDGRGTLDRLRELQQSQTVYVCVMRFGDTLDNCENAWFRATDFPNIDANEIVSDLEYEPYEQKLGVTIENNAPYPESATGIEFTMANGAKRIIDFPEPLTLPANSAAGAAFTLAPEEHDFLISGGQYSWRVLLGRSGISQSVDGQLSKPILTIIDPALSRPTFVSKFLDTNPPYFNFDINSELSAISLENYQIEAILVGESGIPLSGWSDRITITDSELATIGKTKTSFAASINETFLDQNLGVQINLYAPRETVPVVSSLAKIPTDKTLWAYVKEAVHFLIAAPTIIFLILFFMRLIVEPIQFIDKLPHGSKLTTYEYYMKKKTSYVLPSKGKGITIFFMFFLGALILMFVLIPWDGAFGAEGTIFGGMLDNLQDFIIPLFLGLVVLPMLQHQMNSLLNRSKIKSPAGTSNGFARNLNIDDIVRPKSGQSTMLKNIVLMVLVVLAVFILFSFLYPLFILDLACDQPADWLRLTQGGCNG